MTHCILGAEDLRQHLKEGKLRFLSHFVMEWPCLQVAGALLPDLVKLYQWLHTDIAVLLTQDKASTTTIGEIIKCVEEKKSGIRELYENVKKNYNEYVELIGGVGEPGSRGTLVCGENRRFTIADDIPLLHFLTGVLCVYSYIFSHTSLHIDAEEEGRQGNDWLYIVLADVVTTHNYIIKNAYAVMRNRESSKRLLPKEPSKIFLTVVSIDNTIAGGLTQYVYS